MNENRILVLVTYTSIASLLTLILMIVYGSINIDENKFSEWLAPSTIATLIGGLGGALAGTWLSGRNATKQWKKQKENEVESKKVIFNNFIYQQTNAVFLSNPLIVYKLSIIENLVNSNSISFDEEVCVSEVYKECEQNIKVIYDTFNDIYVGATNMSQMGNVDWDTYNTLNIIKINFSQITLIRNLSSISESMLSSNEELIAMLSNGSFSEQREYISKVFNARRDLFTAQKSVFLAINHLIELNGSLVHKR